VALWCVTFAQTTSNRGLALMRATADTGVHALLHGDAVAAQQAERILRWVASQGTIKAGYHLGAMPPAPRLLLYIVWLTWWVARRWPTHW
jgi:hypothetical protein